MSSINGDKAKHHVLRKMKIARDKDGRVSGAQ
jgi:hypothetical protein